MNHLILASGSPRRKELLETARIPFSIQKSSVHENVTGEKTPAQYVEELALRKARSVHLANPQSVVLAADTVVVYDGTILGKPETEHDALEMISMLSGKQHTVYTGVTILNEEKVTVFHEATDVTFWPLMEDEMKNYVRTGESMDKAGSYGIQGIGATLVKSIKGDYYNVVGLPISRTVRELKAFGITQDLCQSRK